MEREASRVKIALKVEQWRCHRPHPGKGAKRYQVEEAREFSERVGSCALNTMTHQGYTARIEFDERDNIFVGRATGLRTMISSHGENVKQLHRKFEAAVEDFLLDCKKQGIRPEKPVSGKLILRVPPELHGAALVAAKAADKSLNQWATELLQNATQTSTRKAHRA